MKISLRWLNEYLSPAALSASEAEQALTFAGFPIETTQQVDLGGGVTDTMMDVEVTSNRGDVLSHVGVAREVAALSLGKRSLKLPPPDGVFNWSATPAPALGAASSGGTGDVSGSCAVDNRVPDVCRLFTARVIRGVKVGPSPKWMVDALAAVGQRSINNIVDITNFVALEYGQPSHAFDLGTIGRNAAGKAELIVRYAVKGEKLKLLDGKVITLVGDELVVADPASGGRAISLAGVMGGAETEVTEKTTDVILEAATWEPLCVRKAARRFQIRTDASHRFERIVDPRTIERAAARAAGLIVRLAGGTLLPGVINAGPSMPANQPIRLRPTRVAAMLGVEVSRARIIEILRALEIEVKEAADALMCTAPAHRPDLPREIDLIEEVARIHGLDKLPVSEKVGVRVLPPQKSEAAMRELTRVMTGLGFYEALTFTFVSEKQAKPFLPKELSTLAVQDARRKADPVLRPSAIPSLLACRRANQAASVAGDGVTGVRLFETSAVFAQTPAAAGAPRGTRGKEVERRNLAMIADAGFPEGGKAFERKQNAVRVVRGAIESLVHALGGAAAVARLGFEQAAVPMTAYDPAAAGVVKLGGAVLGVYGLLSDALVREHDLTNPVAAAELALDELVGLYPPKSLVRTLPQFPSIERDLSLVVGENVAWAAIEKLVSEAGLPQMEECWFVGTYRGQPIAAGKKSVTLRMRFRDRDDQRTLRHEEVDPQVDGLVKLAKDSLGAELRV